jgi:hypothetical protein
MGLAVTAEFDPVTLFTTGNYPSHGGMLTTDDDKAALWYYDRLDFFSSDWSWGGSPADVANEYVRWDPLLQSNSGSLFDSCSEPVDGLVAVGEWDRVGNAQKVYTFDTGVGTGFDEVSVLSPNNINEADVWPTVGGLQHRGSLISTDPGFYDLATEGGWVIFETWGFAFNPLVRLRHTDAVQYADVPVLVNLATGAATLLEGLFTAYGTQIHQFAEPALLGQNVNFAHVQFIPDDISTPAQPRGRVFMSSSGANSPSDSTMHRYWVKMIDWNPFDVDGTPSRTHLRTRLLSAADFLKSAGGTFGGVFESGSTLARYLFYHPRTNRIIHYTHNGFSTLGAGESKFLFVSASPTVSVLTDPSPTEETASGKTNDFIATALGSLGEEIGGVDVAFELRRVSTIGEVLATTPSAGETVVVDNGPISPVDPNLSPVVVYENGTPLTLTTHYTVNRGAGSITFVAPKPLGGGEIYTADYRHFDTPTSPPTGATLLNSSAVSDITGAAVARVRHDEEDPVADRWYRIDATQI